jgi:hypothetical protein
MMRSAAWRDEEWVKFVYHELDCTKLVVLGQGYSWPMHLQQLC